MSALLGMLLLASPWSAPRHLVFGSEGTWVLWDVQRGAGVPLSFPADLQVEQAISSANGQTLFLIARPSGEQASQLFRWEPATKAAPVRLGTTAGFHGQLSLSRDEKWLFFTFHPHGAPPGKHEGKAFAQLHRIRTDGTAFEQLTTSEGCKIASCPLHDQQLMIHSDCASGSSLEALDLKSKDAQILPLGAGRFTDLDVAPDGSAVLLLTSAVQGARMVEWSTAGKNVRIVAELGFGFVAQPRFGRSAKELLYWDGASVRSADHVSDGRSVAGGAK